MPEFEFYRPENHGSKKINNLFTFRIEFKWMVSYICV